MNTTNSSHFSIKTTAMSAMATVAAITTTALTIGAAGLDAMAHPHKGYTLRLSPSCGFEVLDLGTPVVKPFGLTTGLKMASQGARIIRIREICPWDVDHQKFQVLPQNNSLEWGPIPPIPPLNSANS